MGGGQLLQRIPRIRFPTRHPNSGSTSHMEVASKDGDAHYTFSSRSDVPAAPKNTAVGGKASLLPKRTPVSDKEVEAILLGACF
ncbi:uncharacterized protein LOC131145393 [Malania oleifera]|uniref:uncharacterized protein LOC131145393 n=1 Tax=Malania oleifera TaxID=397392 RepID=UPI0025ADA2FF|nr:uncharacterized protein LOC131145393 [Malania oleifera]